MHLNCYCGTVSVGAATQPVISNVPSTWHHWHTRPSARKLDADWLVDELNPSGFGWCHILILCVWLSCSDNREPTGSRSLIHPSAARAHTFSLASSSFSRLALPTQMARSKLWKRLFFQNVKLRPAVVRASRESDNHQWCSGRSGFSTR